MFLKKMLILFLIVAAMTAAYFANKFLKKKLDPERSLVRFILFVLINLATIFGLIFLLSFFLFKFKDFFFKT